MTQTKKGLSQGDHHLVQRIAELGLGDQPEPRSTVCSPGVKKKGKTVYTKRVAARDSSRYADGHHQVTVNLKKPFKGAVQLSLQGSIAAANGASAHFNVSMIVK